MNNKFANIKLEVIDINVNSSPDIFINQNGVTFSKRVLEDLNYPQNVQFCLDAAQKVFAIRPCKGSEAKASAFSKPKAEQTTTLTINNKNVRDILTKMVPDFNEKKRYKITGFFDSENRIMYYDMNEAEVSTYRSQKNKDEE